MKKLNSIESTKKYDMFKYVKGNRKLDPLNVRRLVESMRENYEFTLVIINEFMEVIDGQHRIAACKELGLEVLYIIIHGLRLKDVQKYNSNQKVWTKMDYALSYADAGFQPYIILLEFMKQYPEFNLGAAENMLTDSFDGANEKAGRLKDANGKPTKGRNKSFQKGELEIDMAAKIRGYEIAAEVVQYKQHFRKYNSGRFVKVVISLLRTKGYSNDEMVKQVAKNPYALIEQAGVKQYKLVMQDIYNHGKREANRLAFYK